jgi:hypothetical protein
MVGIYTVNADGAIRQLSILLIDGMDELLDDQAQLERVVRFFTLHFQCFECDSLMSYPNLL